MTDLKKPYPGPVDQQYEGSSPSGRTKETPMPEEETKSDGWEEAKEAVGCLMWTIFFFVFIALCTAGPKLIDALEKWNP